MSRFRSERGAAAVEFALVLPILVAVLLGIVEFGRAYNAQITITHAAREAARTMAVQDDPAAARTAARNAAPSLNPALTDAQINVAPADCTAGATTTITVQHNVTFISGWFGPGVNLTGTAAMRCGG
ncbi:TadE/TadG family type IV pilus assembly protein [Kocuria rosea]|uniref:Pilus assembly protein n=1 Tax=Kocuria rosea TaxID=1275 RepID=A0A4R5YN21_KOCRO|nr:TadE/TadG family type IV pilus assembly protein [Kocuria rosea]TDL46985.1 pilus assembly protein [Kocuria rosea]